MANITDLLKRERRRSKEESAQARKRFVEILGIVRKHDLRAGLTPETAVALIQDLGTTFVKLGQIASTHPDVLPQEYCEALGALRTKANPMDFATVRTQVETELSRPLEEIFTSFDETAVGSASIAQVHGATLPDGAHVAVKVQRPGVVEQVTEDLAIMERLVELYSLVDRGESGLSLKDLVAEMVRTSTEELDFRNEAANLVRFHANNQGRAGITVPRCYPELCTSSILVEDFADAPCVEDIDALGMDDAARDKLAYLVAGNYMQQIMEDGFYHADPHAGNVLVLPGGGVEWIDFGMMGAITSGQRETLQQLLTAFAKGDAYGLKRAVLKVATPTGPVDHAALLEMCESMADQFGNMDLESFDTGALFTTMTDALKEGGFDVDPFLVNLGRGLVTLEGTIHLISPRLNIMQVVSEYLVRSFDPSSIAKKAQHMAGRGMESMEALAGLPAKASDTLDMVQKGHVKVGMELSANEKFSRDIRGAAGLVALAMVAMALIIGACILGASETAWHIGAVSGTGLMGLACGVGLAVYIIVKIRPFLK